MRKEFTIMKKRKAMSIKNNNIMVISPSMNLVEGNQQDLIESEKNAKQLKLNTLYSKNSYFTSQDEKKLIENKVSDIKVSFSDNNIQIIIASKGGLFTHKLLNHIDFDTIKNNPKIIIGMSDITSLLNAIYAKTGLITFHSCIFKGFLKGKNEYNMNEFVRILINSGKGVYPKNTPWLTIRKGSGTGTLVGGNLTSLNFIVGTEYFPKEDNYVLFLEDPSFEIKPDTVKKSLLNLKKNGIFNKTNGILVGNYDEFGTLEKLVLEVTKEFDFPIIKCDDFGHTYSNTTFAIGATVKIDSTKSELIL